MSVFSSLSTQYPTWESLSSFLKSEAGGFLRVDDHSKPEQPFALIRYVKGKSNLDLPHVRAFRSVVWDVSKNIPVSIAPMKSENGEDLPEDTLITDYTIEPFVDGVMVCGFYDEYNKEWRFHTRSTLDANCRFFSQTKSFITLFKEAISISLKPNKDSWNTFLEGLNKELQYSWVLQHPENRVVVSIPSPTIVCVQKQRYAGGELTAALGEKTQFDVKPVTLPSWDDLSLPSWDDLRARLLLDNAKFKHNTQGYVVKRGVNKRWKIRTSAYNQVRKMRGNSARRDFLWLSLWRSNTLRNYLAIYPEERDLAKKVVDKWKQITAAVYHIYNDVFKTRSMNKANIAAKYRPFVFGLHNHYINNLRPHGKVVDWKEAVSFMNGRDTAQALHAINWEIRAAAEQVPVEGQSNLADEALPAEIIADDNDRGETTVTGFV